MKEIELRRHAAREKGVDALSAEGRVQAENLGRAHPVAFSAAFVSPAKRTAETVAWILRGSHQRLPDHAVIEGLATGEEARWRKAAKAVHTSRLDAVQSKDPELVAAESQRLAGVVSGLFGDVPEGTTALAVGHSPLIEAAVFGLTGAIVEPLRECEGINLTLDDAGQYRIEELRLAR